MSTNWTKYYEAVLTDLDNSIAGKQKTIANLMKNKDTVTEIVSRLKAGELVDQIFVSHATSGGYNFYGSSESGCYKLNPKPEYRAFESIEEALIGKNRFIVDTKEILQYEIIGFADKGYITQCTQISDGSRWGGLTLNSYGSFFGGHKFKDNGAPVGILKGGVKCQ